MSTSNSTGPIGKYAVSHFRGPFKDKVMPETSELEEVLESAIRIYYTSCATRYKENH